MENYVQSTGVSHGSMKKKKIKSHLLVFKAMANSVSDGEPDGTGTLVPYYVLMYQKQFTILHKIIYVILRAQCP